ncbi:hypothetical protein ACI0FM_00020 [Paenochrobactrum sp. BZR 588]|uniref:hypothetical protein n=1 Tax=unclassified Paenochrobactrum TaxID=2639760 RepID=UPI003853D6D5
MTTVKCQCCKKPFDARTADVNRGWGKFCSKSCKAIRQTKLTGVSGADSKASGMTVKQMQSGRFKRNSLYSKVQKAKKLRPWQRFDKCRTDEDRRYLIENPRVIERDWDGEELFFANFSNEEGGDI